jgi:hypothetical protein
MDALFSGRQDRDTTLSVEDVHMKILDIYMKAGKTETLLSQ